MNVSKKLGQIDQNILLQRQLLEARVYFQGLRVDNVDAQQALSLVNSFLHDPDRCPLRKVFFTNVHSIHLSRTDNELRSCINEADLVLPDGSGLKIAGRILRHPIVENLNGTDFIPKVLERAAQQGQSVYLLGAQPGVAEQCRRYLQTEHPKLSIVGHHHGHLHESDEQSIIADINDKAPDILLVALGTPLQEKWISRNAFNLHVGVCFAVGGLFDFLSGQYPRAPAWIRRIGAEAIFRFAQDPRSKWRRIFIELPLFLFLIVGERIVPWRASDSITRLSTEK